MDARSTLAVGVDVPWVTSWTAEAIEGVRPCQTVGGRLALGQAHRPGYGKPQYSKNHLVRQRLSVLRMLCPMCGQPTAADDRWTEVAKRRTAGALRQSSAGGGLPAELADNRVLLDAGSITPLHKRCVERSLAHCPHLKHEAEVKVIRFPPRWVVTPLMIEATNAKGGVTPVVAFLQICGVTDAIDRRWAA